jgi:CCR4-NOT transcription complex subunit 1
MFGVSTNTTASSLGGAQSPFPGLGVAPPLPPGPPPPRPPPSAPTAVVSANNPIEQVRSGNIASLFPDAERTMTREVEDEANSYFQRIYNHPPHPTLSIDEVLELLKKFQTSGGQRETDVFTCMIKAGGGHVCIRILASKFGV